ncbi:hypothetical protein GCM10027161_27270 [Microbispora hainanensis]
MVDAASQRPCRVAHQGRYGSGDVEHDIHGPCAGSCAKSSGRSQSPRTKAHPRWRIGTASTIEKRDPPASLYGLRRHGTAHDPRAAQDQYPYGSIIDQNSSRYGRRKM